MPGLLGELLPEKTFTHSQLSWSAIILYLLPPFTRSIASSLFNLRTRQSFCTTSLQDYLLVQHPPLHTPYISSPNHRLLFATHAHTNATCTWTTKIMSSIPSSSLNYLLGTLSFTLMPHIHLMILISAHWSATPFSFLTGQVSLPYNILHCTYIAHNCCTISLSLSINYISLLVSSGINCLTLLHLIRILVSTGASASPSALNMSLE